MPSQTIDFKDDKLKHIFQSNRNDSLTCRARLVAVQYNRKKARSVHSEYIDQRDGRHYVAGTRIFLDSIVYLFNEEQCPEGIQEDLPFLKLSQIYGAIALYLDHKPEADQYLASARREFEAHAVPLSEENPGLWERLQHARTKFGKSVR